MTDERGVSITLNYVLTIAIATLLVTGLLVAGGNFVETQRDGVVNNELSVVGQRLAADIEHVDRLAASGDGTTTVRVNRTLPDASVGSRYDIELDAAEQQLVLTAEAADVSVTVPVSNRTDLSDATVSSGEVTIVYDGSAITIEDDP